jgi:hypothetical protein
MTKIAPLTASIAAVFAAFYLSATSARGAGAEGFL